MYGLSDVFFEKGQEEEKANKIIFLCKDVIMEKLSDQMMKTKNTDKKHELINLMYFVKEKTK